MNGKKNGMKYKITPNNVAEKKTNGERSRQQVIYITHNDQSLSSMETVTIYVNERQKSINGQMYRGPKT
jgi:hypothetical protein